MLSEQETQQFVERGYLVKRIELAPALIERAIDLTWSHIDPRFVRTEPDTWEGEIADSCRTATITKRRGRVKLRECVQGQCWLADIIQTTPAIGGWVRDLLGPKGVPRKTIRGLYPVFPSPHSSARLDGGMDAHPFQVSCIVYLSDVHRDGGEFTVWAGSHRIMCDAFDGPYSWKLNGRRQELTARAEARCKRIGLPGPAGTVILWHHRCLHTPATNRSREVRHAVVGDFLHSDWKARGAETYDAGMWAGWAVGETPLANPWVKLRRWLGGGERSLSP